MNIKFSALTRIFTAFILIAFIALGTLFVSNFTNYIEKFTDAPSVLLWGAAALLAIPCAAILIIAFSLSTAIERDTVFTARTADTLSFIAMIFLIDCALFLACIIALFSLGEATVAPLLAIIDLIGFALGVLLKVLSGYIRRAAELKEEADATL